MANESRISILQMARGAIQKRVDYEVGKAIGAGRVMVLR